VGAGGWPRGVVGLSVVACCRVREVTSTEEPALRDVEPVTLALESFAFVLPGPSARGGLGVGEQLAVDGVAHVPFEGTERFFFGLALRKSAIEVRAPLGVRLAKLTDRDHVDRVIESAVPAP